VVGNVVVELEDFLDQGGEGQLSPPRAPTKNRKQLQT
jgi:hypothetical protein